MQSQPIPQPCSVAAAPYELYLEMDGKPEAEGYFRSGPQAALFLINKMEERYRKSPELGLNGVFAYVIDRRKSIATEATCEIQDGRFSISIG